MARGLAQDVEREEWGSAYADRDLVFARENGVVRTDIDHEGTQAPSYRGWSAVSATT